MRGKRCTRGGVGGKEVGLHGHRYAYTQSRFLTRLACCFRLPRSAEQFEEVVVEMNRRL